MKFASDRHHRHAIQLPAMDMTEALDVGVAVNVTVHPVIADAGVRAEVHHAKRPAR